MPLCKRGPVDVIGALALAHVGTPEPMVAGAEKATPSPKVAPLADFIRQVRCPHCGELLVDWGGGGEGEV